MYLDHLIKSALKKLGRNYGVHVRYMPRLINKGPDYEVVLPNATYSPWNLDEGFKTAYSQVSTRRLSTDTSDTVDLIPSL